MNYRNYRKEVRQGRLDITDHEPKLYNYEYDLRIGLSVSVEEKNRKEADRKLTEAVRNYFMGTGIKVSNEEIINVIRYEV